MNILVIGGSYFLGKAFVEMAYITHNVTVFNRGNNPLGLPGVKEIVGERHDAGALSLLQEDYDVIVDFCAYNSGDISSVINSLHSSPKQYVFVSTCDVYQKGTSSPLDENSALERRKFAGEVGEYIAGKVQLEDELVSEASKNNINYTSIRPSVIYGPGNYAPREGIFFHWITNAGQILYPNDATGTFQMVYVGDVSRLILNVCQNSDFYNQAVNVCGNEITSYASFCDALALATDTDFERVNISVEDIISQGIPLPFPLNETESEEYTTCHKKISSFDYIPLSEGLRITYNTYREHLNL